MAESSRSGARAETADFWDQVLRDWLPGRDRLPGVLAEWADSYQGRRGLGAVDFDAIPEPYIGPMRPDYGDPAMVFLGLNPGGPAPEQRENAAFHRTIGASSYSRWAASAPYATEPWISAHGTNRYQTQRVRFARQMTGRDDLDARILLLVEMYPWHSARVTKPMAAPADMLKKFVWAPLAEIDVEHVFAFGAPWERMARQLGLLGESPVRAPWTVPSRRVTCFDLPSGQRLVVSVHSGSAGPPAQPDAERLRNALRTG